MTRPSGVAGACTTTGGSEQKYKYDAADRLVNEGIVYDDFGLTTTLPSSLAGGNALTASYFSTDMVASQTQDGVTNTFQLDAALRQRQRPRFKLQTLLLWLTPLLLLGGAAVFWFAPARASRQPA